ncbi:MAG: PfkB family carbohydrate kinase [Ilumatobacteraceae bacterium]
MFDPLADQRRVDSPQFDVFVWGTVFLDIIFAGLPSAPSSGTEVWAEGMASCPGGIANLAVAAQRLGLRTSLAAAFSDDDYGDFCWRTLSEQEQIDLSKSQRFAEWHSPVTVSMSVNRDRSMVSHGHPSPISATEMIGTPPCTRTVMVDLGETARLGSSDEPSWVDAAKARGALVFADVGWDPNQRWPESVLDQLQYCHAFMPNAIEAMSYTRTDTALAALYALADRVPLAVVTNGADGALAIDATTGEEAQVPALQVTALDPTGAGDVFGAAMVMGTLAGWALRDRLAFASLCSALALQQFGGSLAAPGWGDVIDWWHGLVADPAPASYHQSLLRRYAFLHDIAPHVPSSACRRATATIARRADVEGLR